ncbi:MAG: ABC transporter substrate-binding protein [Candidatus Thorarchaeota archaeon]|nr:MAG: ABC transporter substrate-binding protein [Candidatus Thorarchaeota archaeon]
MSEFEASRNVRTSVLAVAVILVIGVAATSFIFLGGFLNPGTTTTTTTTSGPITLTILTRHDVAIHNVYEPAFLATDYAIEHQITDIDWKTPDSSFWDTLIDLGQIDVCWGGGPTIFDQLMVDGRLAPLNSTVMQGAAARVPAEIAGADMKRNNSEGQLMWIAAAISSFGFTVDHNFLDTHGLPTPTNWTDLAGPIWGSLLPTTPTIGIGNAPDTTSNTRIYEIMTQYFGWDEGWINMARIAGSSNIYGGSADVQLAVRGGEVGVGMTIDFYGFQNEKLNPNNEYILPADQTIVNGDPIAVAAKAPHKEAAEAFVDWVLSARGQVLWLNNAILRMPVLEEAFWEPEAINSTALYASFNKTKATVGIDFNDTLSLLTNTAFILYWQSVFTDAQTELVQCWTEILTKYYGAIINQTQLDYYASLMGRPVSAIDYGTSILEKFTLNYALLINHDMASDTTYSSQMRIRWTNAAKSQYISVYNTVHALT